jgi:hypothetical protein
MTETAYKQFDKQLHDTYDAEGREIVKKYVHDNHPHLTAVDNPDQYAVDLCIYKENTLVGYAEVEVRTNWKTEHFPFKTLHVPERKTKLLNNTLPTLFFSINEQLTHMYYCKAQTVLNSPLVNVPNKYVSNNEHFYNVHVNQLTKTPTNWTTQQ